MRNSLSLQTDQNSSRRLFSYVLIGLSAAATFLWSGDAHAVTTDTMGKIVCNVVNQIYSPSSPAARIAVLMTGIAYIAGAIAIGNGLFKLKEYAENPGRPPLHQPIARLVGGAALLALPAMLGWIIKTMLLTGGAGGLTTCAWGAVSPITGSDPSIWFINLVKNIKDPMTILVSVLGYTLGTLLMLRGLLKLSKFGVDPNAYSMPKILANMVVGGIIFTIGSSANIMMNTMFGTGSITGSSDVMGWAILSSATASNKQAVASALMFVQIVGMISFLRGWYIVKGSVEGSGQATMAQGITHIVGGVLCLNIIYVVEMFNATLSLNLL